MEVYEPDELGWLGEPGAVQRGCSLGNRACFVRATPEADLDGLWLAANNRWYTGELSLCVVEPSQPPLAQVGYGPFHQDAFYRVADSALAWKKRLVLDGEAARVFLAVRFSAPRLTPLRLVCDWRIGAALSVAHRQQPHWQDCERQWKVTEEVPQSFLAQPCDGGSDHLRLTTSHTPLSTHGTEPSRLRLVFELPASEEETDFRIVLEALPAPLSIHRRLPPHEKPYDTILSHLRDTAPSNAVERAVAWGKIGSRRVWHRYGTGDEGFTNDPPGNTVVTRDAAWFLFGADHFQPDWSRELLLTLAQHAVYPEGKIAEFVRLAPEGVTRDDYGLNLNDATPLYILGVAHHIQTTADTVLLAQLAPSVSGAAEWILAQRREDGLVWCDGKKTNVWGIGGWRNIIPGYRLSGALTELNAECVAALHATAQLAQMQGDTLQATHLSTEAQRLSEAMSQLVNPQTGYFYLTRDEDGPNSQLAIDLAFPALFEAGPEEARLRTLFRLLEPDFQHRAGLTCLSRQDPAYHPRFGWGLMGGSWPNATAWVAAALAPHRPSAAWELAERIALTLFPETWTPSPVSVPGQFPEWFDGDTGQACGMSLSPWMPATYVWLVEERLVGVGR